MVGINKLTTSLIENAAVELSLCILQTITDGDNKNIIFSPLSVHLALCLLLMGSKGRTAKELVDALTVSDSQHDVSQQYKKLLADLKNEKTLKFANKIYVMEGQNARKNFKEIAVTAFSSDIESIDFSKSKTTVNVINAWISKETDNKIKNLILSSDLNEYTRMVLVNAIYFKGMWQKPFRKDRTIEELFYVTAKHTKKVNMMHLRANLRYGELPNFRVKCLELLYNDSKMSMLIVLPFKIGFLSKLEERLNALDMRDVRKSLELTNVEVSLPKFKIEFQMELGDVCRKLGIKHVFDSGDLSEIVESTEPLEITEFVHKAVIDVSEEGVIVAATSYGRIASAPKRIKLETKQFTANHPFKFFLLINNIVVFAGKMIE